MENYTKLNSKPVIEQPKEPWDIYVGSGSKVKVVISKALKILEETKESAEKVVLIGFGPTLNKTITCVEIIKRNRQDLHQNNKLFYKKMEDTWVPNQEGLDRLTVTRNVPAIKIVLSKTPLDVNEPGYQAPTNTSRKKTSDYRRQKPGHSVKKKNETKKMSNASGDKSQGKAQMPQAKRFRPSHDK